VKARIVETLMAMGFFRNRIAEDAFALGFPAPVSDASGFLSHFTVAAGFIF
jgi:hypothetical protein